jgi:hypothetical protein
MTQFTVYRNKNPRTKTAFRFWSLCDLLEDLQTRVVILAAMDFLLTGFDAGSSSTRTS